LVVVAAVESPRAAGLFSESMAPGEGTVYLFDFGLGESPTPRHVGHTLVDTFDANSDRICFARTQTRDGAYTASSSVSWSDIPLRTGSSVQVTFYGIDAAMNFTDLGTLSIDYWIAKYSNKLRRSRATGPFLPAPGCP
jgi:hypothetical protein